MILYKFLHLNGSDKYFSGGLLKINNIADINQEV